MKTIDMHAMYTAQTYDLVRAVGQIVCADRAVGVQTALASGVIVFRIPQDTVLIAVTVIIVGADAESHSTDAADL